MSSKRTLLILGAGASVPFGYPSGRALLAHVCSQLSKEAAQLFALLRNCGFEAQDITGFRESLWRSGQGSIDAFLEHRPEFLGVGKAAIAASLLPYEREENLFQERHDDRNWYKYLFGRIGSSLLEARDDLAVITFNYDRSLDHFLYTALRNSYNLTPDRARDLLLSFRLVHVYGKLSDLPHENTKSRPYAPADPQKLVDIVLAASESIKIVHEGTPTDPEFNIARGLINQATLICFLGFGYLKANLTASG